MPLKPYEYVPCPFKKGETLSNWDSDTPVCGKDSCPRKDRKMDPKSGYTAQCFYCTSTKTYRGRVADWLSNPRIWYDSLDNKIIQSPRKLGPSDWNVLREFKYLTVKNVMELVTEGEVNKSEADSAISQYNYHNGSN